MFGRETSQTGVADASKAMIPLLKDVAAKAQAAILGVTAADAKRQASQDAARDDALRQAQLLAELQNSA